MIKIKGSHHYKIAKNPVTGMLEATLGGQVIDHCTSDNLLYLMKTIRAFDINIGIRSWFTFHDKHLADLKDWDGDL